MKLSEDVRIFYGGGMDLTDRASTFSIKFKEKPGFEGLSENFLLKYIYRQCFPMKLLQDRDVIFLPGVDECSKII